MRTQTVNNQRALSRATNEYVRDGYYVKHNGETRAVVRRTDNGSLLTHLALFFTVGWLTLGLLNLVYFAYRRGKGDDTVEIRVGGNADE